MSCIEAFKKGAQWFVTILWFAQDYIAGAKSKEELARALKLLERCADHALPSGVLAEQVHPLTNDPLSVSPLTWSHGAFVLAVQEYLNKYIELDKCPACSMPMHCKKPNFQ